MKLVKSGDTVTVMEAGKLRMTYGQGRRADEIEVEEGEIVTISEACKIDGPEVIIWHAPRSRIALKRAALQQKPRYCGDKILKLEMSDPVNPLVRDIEQKLADRGAIMRALINAEAERLKSG